MNEILLTAKDGGGEAALSELRDPFRADACESIYFRISKSWTGDKINFRAVVEFKNGPTKGEQEFCADDFPSLVQMVDAFTTALKEKA